LVGFFSDHFFLRSDKSPTTIRQEVKVMAVKPMNPPEIQIRKAINTNNKTIRQLKLANQSLRSMLPSRRPSKDKGYIRDPRSGEKLYYRREREE